MISGAPECLLWLVTAGGVLAEADTVTRLEGLLAQALEANEQLTALVERQRVELAARDAELERVTAELVVLKRMLFGRSSERARPATADSSGDRGSGGGDGDGDGDGDTDGGGWPAGRGTSSKRGPGARAGRRDYSHLPRVEVVWDFPDGGYCCPQCQTPFHRLGDHVTEVLDWVVTVRVAAHCRRRYRRACSCRVKAVTSEFWERPATYRSTSHCAMNALDARPLPIAFGGPGTVTVAGTRHAHTRRYRRRQCARPPARSPPSPAPR